MIGEAKKKAKKGEIHKSNSFQLDMGVGTGCKAKAGK